jgi:hypothetical protein
MIKTRLGLLLTQAPGQVAVYRKGLTAWLEGLRRGIGIEFVTPLIGLGTSQRDFCPMLP